ncbi:MAG TPA: DivIVA domain-containing protein [Streptosporangiaceae bacterium]|nr:DivIVA domain-containing protein [Streptosporangiaceae bacterium]
MPAAAGASVGQRPAEFAQDSEVDGARLTQWVRATQFSTTRLRPGYDIEEVDAFLSAIRDTFLGIREPSLTPDEIRTKQFSTTRLRPGYDQEEVDAFLDEAEVRLTDQAGARAHAARLRSVAADQAAGAVRIRCLECGAENAEAAEVCARCGAPASYPPSASGPAVARPAGRSGPSRRLLATAGVATALLVVGWLILALNDPWSSTSSIATTSSIPSTGQLTMRQLQVGDCLQGSGQTVEDFSQGNGPFTGVPCTQPHTAEVFFAGNAWPRSLAYPGDQAVHDHGHARCLKAFSAYDGIDSSSSTFDVVFSTPTSSTWPGDDRRLVCFASSAPGWVDYSIQGLGQ